MSANPGGPAVTAAAGQPVAAAGYAPFLDGIRAGRLLLPRCASCGAWPWPPTDVCPECSGTPHWTEVPEPRGTLFSYTVVRRTTLPAYLDRVPYVVGIVQVDGTDVRLVGLVECDPAAPLTIDQSLLPRFTTAPDGVPAVHWVLPKEA